MPAEDVAGDRVMLGVADLCQCSYARDGASIAPRQRNSLDALCKRYWSTTRTGTCTRPRRRSAARVYLAMTGGQGALI
jgi:hypothetical protein